MGIRGRASQAERMFWCQRPGDCLLYLRSTRDQCGQRGPHKGQNRRSGQ